MVKRWLENKEKSIFVHGFETTQQELTEINRVCNGLSDVKNQT